MRGVHQAGGVMVMSTLFVEVLLFVVTVGLVVWFCRFIKRLVLEVVNLEGQSAFERGLDAGVNLARSYSDLCQRDCPYRSGVHAGAADASDPRDVAQPPPPDPSIEEPALEGRGGVADRG